MNADERASARQTGLGALAALFASVVLAELLHPLASRPTGLRSAVETATVLLAAVIAAFSAVRFNQSGSLRDAFTFVALCIVACLGLTAYALPRAIGVNSGGVFVAAPQIGAMFVAAAIAASAFSNRTRPAPAAAGRLGTWATIGLAAATLSGIAGMAFASAFPAPSAKAPGVLTHFVRYTTAKAGLARGGIVKGNHPDKFAYVEALIEARKTNNLAPLARHFQFELTGKAEDLSYLPSPFQIAPKSLPVEAYGREFRDSIRDPVEAIATPGLPERRPWLIDATLEPLRGFVPAEATAGRSFQAARKLLTENRSADAFFG